MDAVPQAINVMDPNGKVFYANKGVLDYTGLSIEDVKAEDFRARIFIPTIFRTSRLSEKDSWPQASLSRSNNEPDARNRTISLVPDPVQPAAR